MEVAIKKIPLTRDLESKAQLLAIAGDQARIRILCLMFEYKKACVSDIAQALGMSVASISHHLQIMKEHDLFETERIGNSICYILRDTLFTQQLRPLVCGCD